MGREPMTAALPRINMQAVTAPVGMKAATPRASLNGMTAAASPRASKQSLGMNVAQVVPCQSGHATPSYSRSVPTANMGQPVPTDGPLGNVRVANEGIANLGPTTTSL